jgi:hypothetical protein
MSENSEVPDTAMATGNDEGEPGEQRESGPLSADEQELLERLEARDDAPAAPAVEDSPEFAAAADDDAPLPASAVPGDVSGGDQGDELTPEFTDR